jgi:hypothetical protein
MWKASRVMFGLMMATLSHAEGIVGDQIISNNMMDAYTIVPGPNYKVPDAWKCTNYPAKNRRCIYTGTRLGISSSKPGNTPTSLMASPVNPTWWQTVNVPATGTYQVRLVANTYMPNYSSSEVSGQALIVKVGTNVVLSQPFTGMPTAPIGTHATPVTATANVQLTAGSSLVSIGLLKPANISYYGGYTFYIDELSMTYIAP